MAGPGLENKQEEGRDKIVALGISKQFCFRNRLVHHASSLPPSLPSSSNHTPFRPRLCLARPEFPSGSPARQAQLLGGMTQDTVKVKGPEQAGGGEGGRSHSLLRFCRGLRGGEGGKDECRERFF